MWGCASMMHEAELWHWAALMYLHLLLPLGGPIYPEYLEARLLCHKSFWIAALQEKLSLYLLLFAIL